MKEKLTAETLKNIKVGDSIRLYRDGDVLEGVIMELVPVEELSSNSIAFTMAVHSQGPQTRYGIGSSIVMRGDYSYEKL